MITNERIIEEMERQLSFAKSAKDDQTVREALTAVRALCQVVLGGTNTERQESRSSHLKQWPSPISRYFHHWKASR